VVSIPEDTESFLFGTLLGGFFGYFLGYNKQGWNEVIKKFEERITHLKYYKVIVPFGFFQKDSNAQIIYRESLNAHLLGLPNASLPLVIRVLELALKEKYKEVEKEVPSKWELFDLIDWSEKHNLSVCQ